MQTLVIDEAGTANPKNEIGIESPCRARGFSFLFSRYDPLLSLGHFLHDLDAFTMSPQTPRFDVEIRDGHGVVGKAKSRGEVINKPTRR